MLLNVGDYVANTSFLGDMQTDKKSNLDNESFFYEGIVKQLNQFQNNYKTQKMSKGVVNDRGSLQFLFGQKSFIQEIVKFINLQQIRHFSQSTFFMDPQIYQNLLQKYNSFAETRTQAQILLTNQLARALSQININRVMNYKPTQSKGENRVRKQEFLYVYCYGSPAEDNQPNCFNFPGQTIHMKYRPTLKGVPQEETKKMPVTFLQWGKILNEEINRVSTTKSIVLVYHSFGTYIITSYLYLFPSNRVIGMMDVGGAPLRFSPQMQESVAALDYFTVQQMQEMIDHLYQAYKFSTTQKLKKKDRSINSNVLQNKYQFLAVIKAMTDKFGADWVFSQHKQWPNILKCFVYGRNDYIFSQKLLNEKPIYYSYYKNFEQSYQKLLDETYLRLKGQKVSNIQQKFIYNIKGGSHSLHLQNKNKEILGKIASEFFQFIEEIYNNPKPKI